MKYIISKIKGLKMITAGVVFSVAIFVMMSMEVLAQAEGTVIADSAKIRSEANTSSNAVGSAKKGDKLTITEETTGSDGMVWYKVFVDADTLGYIRSDLIEKGEGSISQSTVTVNPLATEVTPITNQSAKVTGNNVRVRDNAGTGGNIVTTIQTGTVITLTGEATGSDGKKWYEVSFISNNNTVSGFIRSDFVQVDENLTPSEEPEETLAEENETVPETNSEQENTQEPTEGDNVEELPESQDYEVVYKQDDEGEYHWYLNNYIEGKGYKVEELFNAQQANAAYLEDCSKTIQNQKMIIAVLAIVLAALLIVITLMTFKLRDFGYEEDIEEEKGKFEERALRTQRPVQEQKRPAPVQTTEGQRRPAVQRPVEGQRRPVSQRPVEGQRRPAASTPVEGQRTSAAQRPVEGQKRPVVQRPAEGQRRPASQEMPQGERRPAAARSEEGVKRQSAQRPVHQKVTVTDNGWKSKNFLTEDDDEFEFEFLNLDNEDE